MAAVCLGASTAQGQSFYILTVGNPSLETVATSINNKNEVAGYFFSNGFTYWSGGWIWLPQANYLLPSGSSYIAPPQAPGGWVETMRFEDFNDNGQAVASYVTGELDVDAIRLLSWKNGTFAEYLRGHYATNGEIFIEQITPYTLNNNGLMGGSIRTCRRTNEAMQCSAYSKPFTIGQPYKYRTKSLQTNGVILDLNSRDQGAGTWIDNGSSRGFLWDRGTVRDRGTNFLPRRINDLGQMAGTRGAGFPVCLYTPFPFAGLPAGESNLSTSQVASEVIAMNNRGHLIYRIGSTYFLWQNGAASFFTSFYSTNGGWSGLAPVGINDQGRITGNGFFQGVDRPFVMGPLLELEVRTSTNRVKLGQPFTVEVTCTSLLSNDLPNTFPLLNPLRLDGTGGASFTSTNPAPATPQVLPARSNITFTYSLVATNAGTLLFTSQVRGSNTINGQVTSLRETSDPLIIGDIGDLLVKADYQADSAYGDDDRYYDAPANGQDRRLYVQPAETNVFHVRIQNDSNTNRAYQLLVAEETNGAWTVSFHVGSNDVSPTIRSETYWTANLATGAYETVTVRAASTGTIAAPGDEWSGYFVLLGTNNPIALDVASVAVEVSDAVVVNTTGDEADANPGDGILDVDLVKTGRQVTLRAAITFVNERAGRDTIRFAIPGDDTGMENGVPRIRPMTALPAFTESVVLDGWSQNDAAEYPPVEIDGKNLARPAQLFPGGMLNYPGADNGLVFSAAGNELRGLAFVGVPFCGVVLDGPSNVVQGCYFGYSGDGSRSIVNGHPMSRPDAYQPYLAKGCGLLVRSAGNRIGGTEPGEGNLFTGNSWPDDYPEFILRHNDTGGPIIAPPGLLLSGAGASGNEVLGNVFGLGPSGLDKGGPVAQLSSGWVQEHWWPRAGVWIDNAPLNVIGGLQFGARNVIAAGEFGIVIEHAGAVGNQILGNWLGTTTAGAVLPGEYVENYGYPSIGSHNADGIYITNAGANVIGGASSVAGNVIHASGTGILLLGAEAHANEFLGNDVHSDVYGIHVGGADTLVTGNTVRARQEALTLASSSNLVVDNAFPGEGLQNAIHVAAGTGNRLTRNVSTGWYGSAISLVSGYGANPPTPNDDFDVDGGPNLGQNRPQLNRARADGDSVDIRGNLSTTVGSKNYHFEFFATAQPHPSGHPQAGVYLGAGDAVINYTDGFAFDIPVAMNLSNWFVTATVTDPDGNTSELSNPVAVGSTTNSDSDDVSNDVENLAPGGDGNGDGTQDAAQSNVTSTLTARGNVTTLAAPPGSALVSVLPLPVPQFAALPAGYYFPIGVIQWTLTNAPAAAVITNFLPAGVTASTFWCYGPVPTNTQPHWYEFLFDGQTGAQMASNRVVLSMADGQRGDHDLTANGVITTLGGPALPIPTGPDLFVRARGAVSTGALAGAQAFELSWPSNATPYHVYFSDSAKVPPAQWGKLEVAPVLSGAFHVVTNRSFSTTRYYLLRSPP